MASELFAPHKGRIPRIDLMIARREQQATALKMCRRDLSLLAALAALASVAVPLSLRGAWLKAKAVKAQNAALSRLQKDAPDAPLSTDIDVRLAQWTRWTKSRGQRQVWRDALHAFIAPVSSEMAVEHIQLDAKGETILASLGGSSENIRVVREYVKALEQGGALRQPHLTGASSDFTFGPTAAKFLVSAQAGKADK